jgi:hypothetical protein
MKVNSIWFRSKWRGPSAVQLQGEIVRKEQQYLLQELQKAHKVWTNSQAQFNFALGKDQIDYAICCMEAAEKRYEMLRKQARELHFNIQDIRDRPSPVEVMQWSSNM